MEKNRLINLIKFNLGGLIAAIASFLLMGILIMTIKLLKIIISLDNIAFTNKFLFISILFFYFMYKFIIYYYDILFKILENNINLGKELFCTK